MKYLMNSEYGIDSKTIAYYLGINHDIERSETNNMLTQVEDKKLEKAKIKKDIELKNILDNLKLTSEYVGSKTGMSTELLAKLVDKKTKYNDIFLSGVQRGITLHHCNQIDDEDFKKTMINTIKCHPLYNYVGRKLKNNILKGRL